MRERIFRDFSGPGRFFGPKKRPSQYGTFYHTKKNNLSIKMDVFPDSDLDETKTKRILIAELVYRVLKKLGTKILLIQKCT